MPLYRLITGFKCTLNVSLYVHVHVPISLSGMVSNGTVFPETLVDRGLKCGFSPVKCVFSFNQRVERDQTESSGVVGTARITYA